MDKDESPQGISRRSALKRIGVAAGIAWTAPIVTSIRTPAFAGSAPTSACSGKGFSCGDPSICGTGSNFLVCFCVRNAAGAPVCANDMYCEDVVACSADVDCPSGWICTADSCCGSVCLPPCGEAPSARRAVGIAAKSGATASGR